MHFGKTRDRVIGYLDFDFSGDLNKRRSLIGYVFTIGGCAISWKVTLQSTVAFSTIEAKYMSHPTSDRGETSWHYISMDSSQPSRRVLNP